jgi:nucleotide-binding universal stress UspA family protein
MFENVLVGVDGSPSGRDALALALALREPSGRLTLAHVHAGQLHPLHAVTPGLLKEEREASERLLREERERAHTQAELVSIIGASPAAALHRQAEEQEADLIVVGSCSRGSFGRAMLGDDARQALNGASCAIAIASRGYAQAPQPIARVGVAYNDTAESRAALECARGLAAATRARLSALEVISIPTYAYTGLVAPIGEGLNAMLEEANERMRRLADVDGRAVYGLTGEELAVFGDELDILVVGSRGYGPLRRLVIGSTSDFLERHARCSLLVLPRAAAAHERAQTQEAAPPAA